jgi:hypothetical protein
LQFVCRKLIGLQVSGKVDHIHLGHDAPQPVSESLRRKPPTVKEFE